MEIRRILAVTFLDLEDYGIAVKQFERVLVLTEETYPNDFLRQGKALLDLADALECNQQFDLAEENLLEFLALEKEHPQPFGDQAVSCQARMLLAWIYLENGQLVEAESLAAPCYQEWLQHPQESRYETFPTVYAHILTGLNRPKEAEEVYRAELTLQRKNHPTPHPLKVKALTELGQCLYQTGTLAEARSLLLESLAEGRIIFGDKNPHGDQALSLLARIAEKEGDSVGALEYFRQAAHAAQLAYPLDSSYRTEALGLLENALFRQGFQALKGGNLTMARNHLTELEELATSRTELTIDASRLQLLSERIELAE